MKKAPIMKRRSILIRAAPWKLKFSSPTSSLFQLLIYTSQLNSIIIAYTIIDEKCIELIGKKEHSSRRKIVKFSIDHADEPSKEMTMVSRCLLFEKTISRFQGNLSVDKSLTNIFEVPLRMKSMLSNFGCFQM